MDRVSLAISGRMLKSQSGWGSFEPDEYGFRAIPAGYHDDGRVILDGSNAYFLSSSERDADRVWVRSLMRVSDMSRDPFAKKWGSSVRCLKD